MKMYCGPVLAALAIFAVAADGFRYVFETSGNTVTAYRAGRMPEVEFVERCG